MPGREAGLLFRDCFMRRAVPDITDWHVQSWENDWPEERPILFVDDKRFENTSFEDVEAALDGVDGGDYGSFFLMFPGGYDATSPSTAGKGTTMWWKPPCLTRTGTSGSPHAPGSGSLLVFKLLRKIKASLYGRMERRHQRSEKTARGSRLRGSPG